MPGILQNSISQQQKRPGRKETTELLPGTVNSTPPVVPVSFNWRVSGLSRETPRNLSKISRLITYGKHRSRKRNSRVNVNPRRRRDAGNIHSFTHIERLYSSDSRARICAGKTRNADNNKVLKAPGAWITRNIFAPCNRIPSPVLYVARPR